MSDQLLSLLFLALAAALVVPIGLLGRWIELRAQRPERTPAE
jgi:hypothetical protein